MSGFFIPDGRNLDQLFGSGNAGFGTGFIANNGQDLGNRYMAGSIGMNTGFKLSDGRDLGYVFGNKPIYNRAHIATIGADIDNAAFWVLYFNNPGASGIYENWGHVGGTEKWTNNDVMLAMSPHMSTYGWIQVEWDRDPNDHNRGTLEIIQIPSINNWNEIRLKQTDPPNGAGWGRYRIYVTTHQNRPALNVSLDPAQSEYWFEDFVNINVTSGVPPYTLSGWRNESNMTGRFNFYLDGGYSETSWVSHFRVVDGTGQAWQHNFTYHDWY